MGKGWRVLVIRDFFCSRVQLIHGHAQPACLDRLGGKGTEELICVSARSERADRVVSAAIRTSAMWLATWSGLVDTRIRSAERCAPPIPHPGIAWHPGCRQSAPLVRACHRCRWHRQPTGRIWPIRRCTTWRFPPRRGMPACFVMGGAEHEAMVFA